MRERDLINLAAEAMKNSYSPYSHFRVGAALLAADGRVFGGCNIENAAYGPSNCAERTAIFKAVSEGATSFLAIAIVGGPEGDWSEFCPPCGVCRQVLAEFCAPDFPVLLGKSDGAIRKYTLAELLPESFALKITEAGRRDPDENGGSDCEEETRRKAHEF